MHHRDTDEPLCILNERLPLADLGCTGTQHLPQESHSCISSKLRNLQNLHIQVFVSEIKEKKTS